MVYECKRCGWSGEVNPPARCLPCCARRTAEWRRANPEKNRDLKRRMHKKARVERRDAYNANRRRRRNKDRSHEAYRRRLEWLLKGDVTRAELVALYDASEGQCWWCAKLITRPRYNPYDPRGFDHVRPRAKGGKHTIKNIIVSCRRCNELKSDTWPVARG